MSKRIIVAGAGHGGLSAAYNLAKSGYDVTVYERASEGSLGYDWADIFEVKALPSVGIPLPKEGVIDRIPIAYYGPKLDAPLCQKINPGEIDMYMQRKDLYAHLIKYCKKAGVKFVYDCTVKMPIMLGCRVIGIETDKGDFYGDMIIDSLGADSVLRKNMPDYTKIQKTYSKYDVLYAYRAIYNRKPDVEIEGPSYRVYLNERASEGMKWCVTHKDYVDVLIGRFDSLDEDKINAVLHWLKEQNPTLGDELLSGGQVCVVPTRNTQGIIVSDGYALVGDSAYMTMPIMGSGMAAALRAGKMLSKVMIEDVNDEFSRETLWQYEVSYMKKYGFDFGTIAMFKSIMTKISASDIAFLAEEGILTEEDISFTPENSSVKSMFSSITITDIIERIKKARANPTLLKNVMGMTPNIVKFKSITATFPTKYSSVSVERWAEKYDAFFDQIYTK